MSLPKHTYIDDTETFRWLAVELAEEPLIALDTESNSLHAYQEQVCLIQLSTNKADYIIDPLAIDDLSPLGVLMSNPEIEIVFHAAEYDLMTLKRDYGFVVENLFDTMVAARLLGYESFGLAAMLEHYFDVKPDKKHQRDDWGRRPLTPASLEYAQMDTHFLPELRNKLRDELIARGNWEEAKELFAEAQDVPAANNSFDPDGFWKIGRPNRLSPPEMAILRELYLWREQVAKGRNSPTFKVVSNQTIVNIAQANPQTRQELENVRGVSSAYVRRYGQAILDAVRRGNNASLPEPPPLPTPPDPEISDRYVILQQWRKEKGVQRGVGSDMVLTKSVLWQLARELPQSISELSQINGLGPRRIELYGEELTHLLLSLNGHGD